jgi:hypothetical protein
MRLIGLVLTLILCLTLAPLVAVAQERQVPRIGILAGLPSADLLPALDQFRQELRKLGWIEGQTATVFGLRLGWGQENPLHARDDA